MHMCFAIEFCPEPLKCFCSCCFQGESATLAGWLCWHDNRLSAEKAKGRISGARDFTRGQFPQRHSGISAVSYYRISQHLPVKLVLKAWLKTPFKLALRWILHIAPVFAVLESQIAGGGKCDIFFECPTSFHKQLMKGCVLCHIGTYKRHFFLTDGRLHQCTLLELGRTK